MENQEQKGTSEVVNGIPSPFPYLNPESDEWKGADERGEDGFDLGGGEVAVLVPHDPEDGGGDEIDPDDEEDEDDMDDGDGFFGVGHWFPKILVAPPTLMPA